MLVRFLIFCIGALAIGNILLLASEKEASPPLPKKLISNKSIPKIEWEYKKYIGFCYKESALGGPDGRGDLLLYGKRKGDRFIDLYGALYRVKGDPEQTVEIRVRATGKGIMRSQSLEASDDLRKVLWKPPFPPQRVRSSSRGAFLFQFQGDLFSNSCRLRFRF